MKAKIKFLKMFYKMPEKARSMLVHKYWDNPMSLNICCLEIKNDTKLGKKILKELGYEDDTNGTKKN